LGSPEIQVVLFLATKIWVNMVNGRLRFYCNYDKLKVKRMESKFINPNPDFSFARRKIALLKELELSDVRLQ